MKEPKLDFVRLIDINTVTRDEIVSIIRKWGRDNGGRYIASLLLQIAELKGFPPITPVDLEPNRSFGFEIKLFEVNTDALEDVTESAVGLRQTKYLGFTTTHKGNRFAVLHYYGKEPAWDDVKKKLKQYGGLFA